MGSRPPVHSTGGSAASETIEAQRQRLFEAAAIVDVCRYAAVSNLGELDGDQLATALAVAVALIDGVAAALERHGGAA